MPKDAFNGLGICVRAKLQQIVVINKLICAHENPFLGWNYECGPFTTLIQWCHRYISLNVLAKKKRPSSSEQSGHFLPPSQKKHTITKYIFHSIFLGNIYDFIFEWDKPLIYLVKFYSNKLISFLFFTLDHKF